MIKKNNKKIFLLASFFLMLTSSVLAKNFGEVVKGFTNGLLKDITSLALVFAFLFFVWRLFRFMIALAEGENANEIKEGKKWMLYAVIVFFVFVSVFGIVKLLKEDLNLNNSSQIKLHLSH